jgi:hypothetical protein
MRGRDAKYGLYISQVSHAYLNMRPFEEPGCFVNGLAFQENTSNGFKWPLLGARIHGVNVIDYSAIQSAH